MFARSLPLLLLGAAAVTGYAPASSAFARPRTVAVSRPAPLHVRGLPIVSLNAAADDSSAHRATPLADAGRVIGAPIRAVRRQVSKFIATVLATLLSTFFFGSPALAATATSTAATIPPAAGVLAAGAGVGAVVYAATKYINPRNGGSSPTSTFSSVEAPAPPADDEPATIAEDALLMAALRDRMLNLNSGADEEAEEMGGDGSVAMFDDLDDDLDDEMREVRDARSSFPVNSPEDYGNTALLDRPPEDGEGADAEEDSSILSDMGIDQKPAADAQTVAFLEGLFAKEASDKE